MEAGTCPSSSAILAASSWTPTFPAPSSSTSLPHMLPSETEFGRAVGALGIGDGDRIVVYDSRGVISAARVWWTFRAFGHDTVSVLDGGLRAWQAEGRPLESGAPTPRPQRF